MPAQHTTFPARRQRGLSMVEQLVGISVTSLLVLLSLPGLDSAKDRQRLNSVAGQLESELQWARSEAVSRNQMVHVAFAQTTQGSCHVIHTGEPGACTCDADGLAQCTGQGHALRSTAHPTSSGVALHSSARQVGFDAMHGTVTPTTTLRLQNRAGQRLNLVVNVVGRIRSCTPAADNLAAIC